MKNMIRLAVLALMIAGLVLAACVPVPVGSSKTYVCSDGKEVSDPAMCKTDTAKTTGDGDVVETTPVADPDPVVVSKDLTPAAQALFDKATKVTTVKFNYFHSDDPYTINTYYVSKDKMKIDLTAKAKYTAQEPYDTIYLNFVTETASGYCESASEGLCADRNQRFELSYAKYKLRTPFQWLDVIESADATGRSKQVDGRQAKELKFKAEGVDGTIWLDSFFGMPVEVNWNGIDYKFQNMLINEHKDLDLVHPQLPNPV